MDDTGLAKKHLEDIKMIAESIARDVTVMEICGGHTNIIIRYGIRDILPGNIRLISGPGCPVCVSPQHDIDCMLRLAASVPIATYGDMMKVPGSSLTLDDIRGRDGRVFEVYSATEVLKLKKDHPDLVFFGVGFETTAPMTAYLLKNSVDVYSVHKLVPPAIHMLSGSEDVNIDGFINPGHVSTIIGLDQYKDIDVPQVVSGFTPERILRAIAVLLRLIRDNKKEVINAYPEAVNRDGNWNARDLLRRHFKRVDSEWRGLGIIPESGLEVKDNGLNAKIKYKYLLDDVPEPRKNACRCSDILRGKIEPTECPLFRKECTPESPQGACMVSTEGSCSIYFNHEK